jgi:hypothetical protein
VQEQSKNRDNLSRFIVKQLTNCPLAQVFIRRGIAGPGKSAEIILSRWKYFKNSEQA